MLFFKRKKIREILKEKELLRVNSLHKKRSRNVQVTLIMIATLIYVIGLIYGWVLSSDNYDLRISWIIAITGVYVMMLGAIYITSIKGNPLLFTDRGIVMYPIVAEYWHDIQGYRWESFSGYRRLPGPSLFSSQAGTCLRIINNGLIQRNLTGYGGTIFATYLIFFSDEQMTIANNLFKEHGISSSNAK